MVVPITVNAILALLLNAVLNTDKSRWVTLEKWTPTAFIVAGVLFIVAFVATIQEISSIANAASPLLGISAFIATFVGMFGMYPRLDVSAPKLALAGVLAATVAALSVLTLLVYVVGSAVLMGTGIGSGAPSGTAILFLLTLLSFGLSFLFYGTASLRTQVPSRAIGLLMVIPALVWPAYVLLEQVLGVIDFSPVRVFFVIAGALLAVGYLLRTESAESEHAEAATAR